MKTTEKYGKKTDIALSLWVKLARAYYTCAKLSTDNIKTFGLTRPQFCVIECLGHQGEITLTLLSSKLLVTGGNITLVVDNLEKEGLVERIRSKEDRRTINVKLTSKGEGVFKNIFKKHADFITKNVQALTEKEQVQLGKLLKKLGTSLKS
jgi:MarR family transcriptional regulator, 2-MHQ and catechol-resistance regulon repressor